MRRRNVIAIALVAVAALIAVLVVTLHGTATKESAPTPTLPATTPHSSAQHPTASAPVPHATGTAVFAFYYLWWDRQHWTSRLGPEYPLTAAPNPLPATLDSSSCGTTTGYQGDLETDISQNLGYDQSNPKVILNDVQTAAKAGLRGFLVNWVGTGTTDQSTASSDNNLRLSYVFQAVHQVNKAGIPFSVILNYQSSAKLRPVAQFSNDFNYFLQAYGTDTALDHTYSTKPEVLMAGTWKYPDSDLQAISAASRSKLYLIGDEKPSTWDAARAQSLDGTSYYWSSQDPGKNKSSFKTLQKFADTVRATPNPDGKHKTWLAPFTPGYNAMLLYKTTNCVPRNDGQTMQELFNGNAASNPDGWTLISWNEISEGSYVVPLTRYGTKYVDELKTLISSAR